MIGDRELSPEEVELVNEVRAQANRAREVFDLVLNGHHGFPIDHRWASIARTHLQEGFMALERSIVRPERF